MTRNHLCKSFTCNKQRVIKAIHAIYSHKETVQKTGLPEQTFFVPNSRMKFFGWSDKKLFTIDVFRVELDLKEETKLKVNLLLFYFACSYNSCSLNFSTHKKLTYEERKKTERLKQVEWRDTRNNKIKLMGYAIEIALKISSSAYTMRRMSYQNWPWRPARWEKQTKMRYDDCQKLVCRW